MLKWVLPRWTYSILFFISILGAILLVMNVISHIVSVCLVLPLMSPWIIIKQSDCIRLLGTRVYKLLYNRLWIWPIIYSLIESFPRLHWFRTCDGKLLPFPIENSCMSRLQILRFVSCFRYLSNFIIEVSWQKIISFHFKLPTLIYKLKITLVCILFYLLVVIQ